ncbi:hypothetical protein MRX96_006134 [Rhipicephalus microplus]
MNGQPFASPPILRAKGDKDLGDWLHLCERYSLALTWTHAEKGDNLVFSLEDTNGPMQRRLTTWCSHWKTLCNGCT